MIHYVKTCDLCGNTFHENLDEVNRMSMAGEFNTFWVGLTYGDGMKVEQDDEPYDLCPECRKELFDKIEKTRKRGI